MAERVKKTKAVMEYGDFQTPIELARRLCSILRSRAVYPQSIIEPTCGLGNFLFAAVDEFAPQYALGLELNSSYVDAVRAKARSRGDSGLKVVQDSFFDADWPSLVERMPDPLLVIGNPPWVTSSSLGVIGSGNTPGKSNFQGHSGYDAISGKSNFDISEWMLIRIIEWFSNRTGAMAMLCKTAVARKVLHYAWKNHIRISGASIHLVDAGEHFGAAVDACFLVCHFGEGEAVQECPIYSDIYGGLADRLVGYRDRQLVSNVAAYDRTKALGGSSCYKWRSGIKHDCAKVMELVREGPLFRNALGQSVDVETECVLPLLKSSDIARGRHESPRRWMLIPQRTVGDNTRLLALTAPKTWKYLVEHAAALDGRRSSIYTKRPRFAIFGVGDYSFAPWKVAISALYKTLTFRVIGPFEERPIVLDDTANFLACYTKEEAEYVASLLCSDPAQEFLEARVFWDSKRPVTVDLLDRLDLHAVAREMGSEPLFARFAPGLSTRPHRRSEACGGLQLPMDIPTPAASQKTDAAEYTLAG